MNEQTNFADGGAASIESPTSVESAPAAGVSHETPAAGTEQMLSQSKVNGLVGNARREGYEKARREFGIGGVQNNTQPEAAGQPPRNAQPNQMGGITQLSVDDVKRQVREELNIQNQQAQNYQVANNFLQKLSLGAGKYSDFKDIVPDQFLESFVAQAPAVFHLANAVDNTSDVMYELAKNPEKIISLRDIAALSPAAAHRKMQELATSLKINEQALSAGSPNEPLNQIKPSTAGKDNGKMTIADFKKADWLKG